ncbi:phage tail spike protein [Aquibacillus kalidii]|uniref:phage tail spike protein n=1 Tax=Aquibacillus kalidii TaxID=2762597 RepID=UPI0016445597|nr:phage tail spike protein [Aquibacillus kalidii]
MNVIDINGNVEKLTTYKDLERNRRVNGNHSLSFLVFENETNKHSFPLVQEESIIEYDNNRYRVKTLDHSSLGNKSFKSVVTKHVFFDLIGNFQHKVLTGSLTLTSCMNHALEGTGYTSSVQGSFPSIPFEKFGEANSISLIQTALDEFGAEMEIDGSVIVVKKTIGVKTDYQIRYKHNLKTISKSVNTDNLATYIKGYGKDGIEAEYTSPNAEKYGIIEAEPFNDERYTTVESLQSALKEQLQDEPEISFEIEFVELKKAGYEGETINLGDTIYVIYEPLGINITARVIEYTEYPEEPTNSSVVLSNFKENITSDFTNLKKTANRVNKILTQGDTVKYEFLDSFVKQATEALHNSMTELQYPEDGGIVAIDKNNNNNIVVFNSGGIGISKDGGKTFRTAMTGEGFVADVINAGTLKAINIEGVDIQGSKFVTQGEGGTATIWDGLWKSTYGDTEISLYKNSVKVNKGGTTNVNGLQADLEGSGLYFQNLSNGSSTGGFAIYTDGTNSTVTNLGGVGEVNIFGGGTFFANEFSTTSSEKKKQDIEEWTENALDLINDSVIYKYRMKNDVENNVNKEKYGLILERETPDHVKSGEGVEQYAMNTLSWKAIQELSNKVTELEKEIVELKNNGTSS